MAPYRGTGKQSGSPGSTNSFAFRAPSHLSKSSWLVTGHRDSPLTSIHSNPFEGSKGVGSHAYFRKTLQSEIEGTQSKYHDNVYGDEFTEAYLDEVDEELAEHNSFGARLRARLAHMILNQRFEMFIGIVIITNFVVIAFETDARARRDNAARDSSDRKVAEASLSVIAVAHLIYSIAYTLECGVRMYVLRLDFFNHMWNNFDLFMVATGILAEILEKSAFDGLDGLRTLRTIRMLRATRVLVSFDELYALVSGLTHAMKALMWAAILMLMVLTMWSIIAVEYVKPLMTEIASKKGFGTCSWCSSAFDNVFLSNLSFFQIISGDGWSHVARPLIEEYAWTALLFIAVIFSMVFGLLNLIVAVIVDSAAQAREADIMNVAARKDATRAAAWDCFNDMVNELDKNDDGEITVEELRRALLDGEELGDLAAYLTTMGVELTDLDMVFELLDTDGDGKVTHHEFTHQLYQMKTQELPITLCYVRNSVSQLHAELERVSTAIQTKLDEILSPPVDIVAGDQEVPEVTSIAVPPAVSGKMGRLSTCSHRSYRHDDTSASHKRVSLFKGKPASTLRTPKTRHSMQIGAGSDMQVVHSSTNSLAPTMVHSHVTSHLPPMMATATEPSHVTSHLPPLMMGTATEPSHVTSHLPPMMMTASEPSSVVPTVVTASEPSTAINDRSSMVSSLPGISMSEEANKCFK